MQAEVVYHPDAEINAEVAREAAHGELVDLAAGFPPSRWTCRCGSSHSRGILPEGTHRCLACGYIGFEGVMATTERSSGNA